MKILLVVDAQKDFINGVLGSAEAEAAIPRIKEKIDKAIEEDSLVIFTQDTHFDDYMETREGKFLPIPHCIKGTDGWKVDERIDIDGGFHIEKYTFGDCTIVDDINHCLECISPTEILQNMEEIEICGFCTDICVISNALILQSVCHINDIPIVIDANACAGVTVEKHKAAIEVMKSCQIIVKEDNE